MAGLVGIGLIMLISQQFLDSEGLPWVVASMGASAVLLFAVPNGPLSQPWSFVVGHLLSAFVGITVAKLINDPVIAFIRANSGKSPTTTAGSLVTHGSGAIVFAPIKT